MRVFQDKVIQSSAKMIAQFEGCSLTPYYDAAGKLTVGYGTLLPAKSDIVSISKEQAQKMLYNNIKQLVVWLIKDFPLFNLHQLTAITSFCYNCGYAAFKKSLLYQYLREYHDSSKQRSLQPIKQQWLRWVHCKGKVLAGLEKRRLKEYNCFINNVKTNTE